MIPIWCRRIVYCSALVTVFGCAATTPAGPRVAVMPAPGKPFDQFVVEEHTCRQYAEQSIGLPPDEVASRNAVGTAAAGVVIGTAAGALVGGREGAPVGAAVGLLRVRPQVQIKRHRCREMPSGVMILHTSSVCTPKAISFQVTNPGSRFRRRHLIPNIDRPRLIHHHRHHHGNRPQVLSPFNSACITSVTQHGKRQNEMRSSISRCFTIGGAAIPHRVVKPPLLLLTILKGLSCFPC